MGAILAGWFMLAMLLGALAAVIYKLPVKVVGMVPGTAKLYAALGQPVNVRGLEFRDVSTRWALDTCGPVLEVRGMIENITQQTQLIPTVTFELRDQSGATLFNWAGETTLGHILKGGRTPFTVRIPAPPDMVDSVQVAFAKGGRRNPP